MKAPKPQINQLRSFAWTMAIAIVLLFGLLLPWLWNHPWPRLPWLIGAGFVLCGLLAPKLLRPVFAAWMFIGHYLGAINSRILLSIAWLVLIFPIGLMLRLGGRDVMNKRWPAGEDSYFKASEPRARNHFEKPF